MGTIVGRRPGRHRLPTVYRPERELFGIGAGLACVSGLLVAAVQEASAAGDHGWATFFSLMLVTDILFYWDVMSDWCHMMSDHPVDRRVDRGVFFSHDDNHHQGEHRDP